MFLNINTKREEIPLVTFGWTVIYSLTFLLIAISPSWAQDAVLAPPTCADGSIGACVSEILEEENAMIDQAELILQDLDTMGLFSLARDQFSQTASGSDTQADLFARIETLRNEHARAKDASEATTEFEYEEMFEQADSEKGKNCKFSDKLFVESLEGEPPPGLKPDGLDDPNSKYNDGKCNIFDAFELDGTPVKVNERKENMCERVCGEKMVGGQPQKGKSKARAVGGFMDALSSARRANMSLAVQRASLDELRIVLADIRLSQINARSSTATSTSHDPCAPGTLGPADDLLQARGFNNTIAILGGVIATGNILTEVLKTAADIADKPCKQTAGGFNASVACIPFTIAYHISNGIVGITSGVRTLLGDLRSVVATEAKIRSASIADNAKACSKIIRDDFEGGQCVSGKCKGGPDDGQDCTEASDCSDGAIVILQTDVEILKQGVEQTNAEIAEIKAELALMKNLLQETHDFLLTPPGRRDGFQRVP